MNPKFVRYIQQLKRDAYAYYSKVPNSSPNADDITNYIVDQLDEVPDDKTMAQIESIVSGNHLVEQLEKLTGKKVELHEVISPGQQRVVDSYLSQLREIKANFTDDVFDLRNLRMAVSKFSVELNEDIEEFQEK